MDPTIQAVLTVISVGVVMGIFKGVEWILSRRTTTAIVGGGTFGDEVTGRVSPLTCSKLRESCSSTLSGLAERAQAQAEQIQEIRESTIRIEGSLATMGASLELAMVRASDRSTREHEQRFHEHGPRTTEDSLTPYIRRDTGRGGGGR